MSKANLNYQLQQVVHAAFCPGASKKSYREQVGSSKTDKIFSYASYEAIKNTSKDFGKYMKTEYPDVRHLADIRAKHVEGYLSYKSLSCNQNTLTKFKTHLESIGLFARKRFRSVNPDNFKTTRMISSNKRNNVKVGNPMDTKTVDTLIGAASSKSRKSNLYNALVMCRATGLRVDEIAHQKASDFHLDERGKYGFGYITVTTPKHNRAREVHITTAEYKKTLKQMIPDGRERIITCTRATLQNNLANLKKELKIDNQALKGFHSIRKHYAQEYFDFVRKKNPRKVAIGRTNETLGHGYSRAVSDLSTYVTNIY
ncbi:hypothetical protein LJC51_07125 [Lachnospiraceae bacterium OttesenSCG-928-J05]|nr:hypothetical protein [Lachnospiraceae bacterium OttesenSCG-928-J05]